MRRIVALAAFALVAASCASATPGSTARSRPQGTAPVEVGGAPGTMPDGEVVPVVRVLDGDSIAVERNGERIEVRLAGINAPESDECHGDASREMLDGLVGDGPVTLVPATGQDDEDQFGRLLRNVWADGGWVNAQMVERGGALALQTGTGDEADLTNADAIAWESGLGMWSETACGSFPPGVVINDARYDPPGRDRDNAVDEFVLIANEGQGPIDITGWVLRDESSQHRYRFPSLVLEPGAGVRIRTGCGDDDGRDLYWCAGDPVWSNGGDTAVLQTPEGTVVDRLRYAGDF